MKKWFFVISLLAILMPIQVVCAENGVMPLEKAHINLHDKGSLQRGAKLYVNYCAGCHSLKYLRYNRMAKDIGLYVAGQDIGNSLLKANLIFTGAKTSDPILSAMPDSQAKNWFGIVPPDLSLVARVRGADWLYTYLHSFYNDPNKEWGTNNLLFPDVAMPNVLVNLQGIQEPVYRTEVKRINGNSKPVHVIDHLVLVKDGSMTAPQFDSTVNDLVNFLSYASEPAKLQRQSISIWVVLFLVIFSVIAYLLKREFWKDIKH